MDAEPAYEPTNPDGPTIPDLLPCLPISGTVLFPMAVLPLAVSEPSAIQLVDDIMRKDRLLAVFAQRVPREKPGPDDIYPTGTAALVHQLLRAPDGTLRLILQGLERVRIVEITATEPYLIGRLELRPHQPSGAESDGLRRAILDLFQRLVTLVEQIPDELSAIAEGLKDTRQLVYLVATAMPLDTAVRQSLLEADPVDAKLRLLLDLLQREIEVREVGRKITTDVQERLSKVQREHILREQLRAIQNELGEGDESSAFSDVQRQLAEARLPDEARKEAERELRRLRDIPQASAEHGLIRTYLDWMLSLPWSVLEGGAIDLDHARRVLDEDHYDLEKLKDRILEHLAVKQLRAARSAERAGGSSAADDEARREPILCFVGPPGVGKTSLGLSIARALGRRFHRIALGGVNDEAEIRGHRRTYIGSMPGRIIQGVKRAGTRDAVFMLDEIDKVGANVRGDPAAALLEVLDPAQNHAFTDNYLGVPFDLSQVLFIATANTLETIAPPLRDRMEILPLAGYTGDEKLNIAKRYLVPKQIRSHSLAEGEVGFEDSALRRIIRGYTREAGVRSLDRQIATICRKVGRRVAEGSAEAATIAEDTLPDYLGRQIFFDEVAERTEIPGVATGLAWTPSGGDVLFVEATMMPSRDERLILTGMLGDVMRESAQAALSFVRANADELGLDPLLFQGATVHIHVPAGAIPKDGPSAGVTMVTALASLASGRPVRHDLAMTGEITLRGKVLPVGGIKEKVMAAHRAGIHTVLVPARNAPDLDDVPIELREGMEFIPVENAGQVLACALTGEAR